jgi:hypothetical protein
MEDHVQKPTAAKIYFANYMHEIPKTPATVNGSLSQKSIRIKLYYVTSILPLHNYIDSYLLLPSTPEFSSNRINLPMKTLISTLQGLGYTASFGIISEYQK